jgi:dolichol-phosphate mannosyltransferase
MQEGPGYGGALKTGFKAARGRYTLTMDADLSHSPTFIRDLWQRRQTAEISIASRYVPGGRADMPRTRYWLSLVLNGFFSRGLSLPVRDMSSGFRLYRTDALRDQPLTGRNFDVLQEILVRAFVGGWKVQEVPFSYTPRRYGSSHARVIKFGLAYLKTFRGLWKLRHSLSAADYDDRAYDSAILLQRYWQRRRLKHVIDLVRDQGAVLDVGCGSSRIIGALPGGSVALDVLMPKLHYARKFQRPLVQASAFKLPFRDGSFPCVLSSHVVEHVPKDSPLLSELHRVLAPGGRLVLATLDHGRWEWRLTEALYARCAPGAYGGGHVAQYTRQELVERFKQWGYTLEDTHYILRGELILALRKPR